MGGGVGNQELYHKYKQPLTGVKMTDRVANTLPVGIYTGLGLTKVNNTTTAIASGVMEIEGTSGNQARIDFTASHNVTTDNSNAPYLVARWEYKEVEDSSIYAVTVATSLSGILSSDIILGKVIFVGGNVDSYDYSLATYPSRTWVEDQRDNLFVRAQDPESQKVDISAGRLFTNGGYISVTTGSSPVFASATSNPRYDLLCVDKTGSFYVVTGVEAASPAKPHFRNRAVLAEIYRPQAQTNVLDENITQMNPNTYGQEDEWYILDTMHVLANAIFNEDQDGKTFQIRGNSEVDLFLVHPVDGTISIGTGTVTAGYLIEFGGDVKTNGKQNANTYRIQDHANTELSYSANPFTESSFASGTTPSGMKCFGGFTAQRTYNPKYMDIAEVFPCEDRAALLSGMTLSMDIETGLAVPFKSSYNNYLGVYSDTYGHLLGALKDDTVPIGLKGSLLVNVLKTDIVNVGNYLIASGVGFAVPVPSAMYQGSFFKVGLVVKVFEDKEVELGGQKYKVDCGGYRRVLVWVV